MLKDKVLIMKRFVFMAFLGIFSFGQVVAQINTDRMTDIGRNALYFEDYVLSIQYFNQVIKAKPYLAEPYFFRGAAKLYLDDFAGAEEDCSKALERNNFMVNAYVCRSYARMSLGNYEGAVADCKKGLEFDIENKVLMLNMGLSQISSKHYSEAEVSLNELINHYPSDVYGYMGRGQLFVEKGDTLSAVDDFSRAISVDRFYAPARAGRGWTYMMLRKYANALPDLNEAIRLDPDNSGYYINRGLTKYNLNDLRGTLDDFDRSIQLNPNSALSYYNRGIIRSQVGDVNRAIEDFDKVIFLESDNYTAIYNRGILRHDVGEYKGAISDFTTIINEYPTFTPAYYQRSESRKKIGDAKGADKDYFAAWNIENKLKAERAAHKHSASSQVVSSDSTNATNVDQKKKKHDLTNYNKVIVAENGVESMSKYQDPMRGRVQDVNTEVEIEAVFSLSFYEKFRPGPERQTMDYTHYLTELSNAGCEKMRKLLITNQELSLTTEQADLHFKSIDEYSKRIGENPESAAFFFARGVDFALVQDLTSAIQDLTRALQLNDKMVLAYFERANLRLRKINVEYASKPIEENSIVNATKNAQRNNSSTNRLTLSNTGDYVLGEKVFGSDYDLVMRDYEHVLALDPNFIFAYFNRGNIHCMQRDYRSAIIDYTKAIEINSDFADAWFNRGITQIYLGDREHGLSDLRMAGQLGIYKAYNIIKRFGGE